MQFYCREEENTTIITIDNELGLKCELSTFGAGIFSLRLNEIPLILTPKKYIDYKFSHYFFGKTLGPVAGRLKAHGYIESDEYQLVKTGRNNYSLHGGFDKSLSFKNREYKIKETSKNLQVNFSIKTKRNENGFPGKLKINVTYEFSKNSNSYKLFFKGTNLENASFFSLSNHNYFNFGDVDVANHYLKMNCDKVAVTDEGLLIEDVIDVESNLDFRRATKLNSKIKYAIKNNFKGTIDDTFLFEKSPGKITLRNDKIEMQISTDLPAVNVYVENTNLDKSFFDRELGFSKRGIAIEPQLFLLDKQSYIIHKGGKKTYKIEYKFK